MTALSKAIQPIQGKKMFLSLYRIPGQSQSNAATKYADHETRDTPPARRPTHMFKTCGMVITSVKIDALPSTDSVDCRIVLVVKQSDAHLRLRETSLATLHHAW
jgi:hypothetical protein